MQNRTIPYGFAVQNGKVQADPREVQVVRSVFEHYCFGATLQEIAEDLKMNDVPYFQGETRWNKNTVKRMLENEKYKGDDTYPAIVSSALFQMANDRKKEKSRPMIRQTSDIEVLKGISVCSNCGVRFKRINTWGSHEKWMCAGGCKCKEFIDDPFLLGGVREIIEVVNADPTRLNVKTQGSYQPTKEVLRAENELLRLIEQPKSSFIAAANSILSAASLRFQCCKYDRGELTSIILEAVKEAQMNEGTAASTIKKCIRKVKINPEGIITAVFQNGAEISASGGVIIGDSSTKTCDED